jgi:hypothetical protein
VAFVSVPKDLSRVKNKVAFSLTSRQLICFGSAAAIGVPSYLLTRPTIGNSAAALLMIALMLPLFFLAMYERDGLPAEKIIRNHLRAGVFWPSRRPYKTENFYAILAQEGKKHCSEKKNSGKSACRKL